MCPALLFERTISSLKGLRPTRSHYDHLGVIRDAFITLAARAVYHGNYFSGTGEGTGGIGTMPVSGTNGMACPDRLMRTGA
jgi:hypothetical protein